MKGNSADLRCWSWCLILASIAGMPVAVIGAPFSVNDASNYAINHSPILASAKADADLENGVVEQVKAGLRPTVSATGTGNHQATEEFAYLGSIPVLNTQKDTLYAGLNGVLPIDISGEIHTAVSQAQFQAVAARCAVAAARNQVVATTRADYFEALRAEALLVSAQEDLSNAQQQVRDTQVQVDAGQMAKFQLERARTAVAAAQNDVLNSQQAADLALSLLRDVMGMNQTDALVLSDVDGPGVVSNPLPAPTSDGRPELLEAEAELEAADKGFKLAKNSMRPTFRFSGNAGYSPGGTSFGQGINTAEISASIVIPILDGGTTRAQTDQAAATRESARLSLIAVKQQVDFEVQQATIRLRSAAAREPVAQAALADAGDTYNLAKMRFVEGEGPQVEVTDAQGALSQAELDLINAHWDCIVARNAYLDAIGQFAYASPSDAATGRQP